eukprot:g890.t1
MVVKVSQLGPARFEARTNAAVKLKERPPLDTEAVDVDQTENSTELSSIGSSLHSALLDGSSCSTSVEESGYASMLAEDENSASVSSASVRSASSRLQREQYELFVDFAADDQHILSKVLHLCCLAGRQPVRSVADLRLEELCGHDHSSSPHTHRVACVKPGHFLDPEVFLRKEENPSALLPTTQARRTGGNAREQQIRVVITLSKNSRSDELECFGQKEEALLKYPQLCKAAISDEEGAVRLWTLPNKTATPSEDDVVFQSLYRHSIATVEDIYSSLHEVHDVSTLLVSRLGDLELAELEGVGGEGVLAKVDAKVGSALRFMGEYLKEGSGDVFAEIRDYLAGAVVGSGAGSSSCSSGAQGQQGAEVRIQVYATDVDPSYVPTGGTKGKLGGKAGVQRPLCLDDVFQDDFFMEPCADQSMYAQVPDDFSGVHLVRGKKIFSFYHD